MLLLAPASTSLPVVERIPLPNVYPVLMLALAVRSNAPRLKVAASATSTPPITVLATSAGKFGTPVGMSTESTSAGVRSPAQLSPSDQSADWLPSQVRIAPVTSKLISPSSDP